MRYLYSLILFFLLPVIFLRLLLRARKLPDYKNRMQERLGIFSCSNIPSGGIWVHAVSVGEVVAAIPLIKRLQKQYPDLHITVTTTTPTGSDRAQKEFANSITNVYLPYDLPLFINNFLRRIRPRCLVIMETELWPNLLHVCHIKKVPILIANGRISDQSFKNYLKVRWFVSNILSNVDMVLAQSQNDAERFNTLGIPKQKIMTAGNLKFDIDLPCANHKISDRIVWIAASTHINEEEIILKVFKKLKNQFENLLLILVPRHPDRFSAVANLIEKNNLAYVRRSKNQMPCDTTDVFFGDTMGELNYFYSLADIAFVGGSLIPIGGHNVLEPMACGVPVVTGTHMFNFREITSKLKAAEAISVVGSAEDLLQQVRIWCVDPDARKNIVKRGREVLANNRGALQKIMNAVAEVV